MKSVWATEVKKVQARNKNNLSGSYSGDSNKVSVGCRGEKKVQTRIKNNLSGSYGGNSNKVCVVKARISLS